MSATMTNPSPIARDFVTRGRCDACPVIDMHGHYGPFSGIYFPKPYAEGMLDTLDGCGMRCIVISGHHALIDPEDGNPEVADVVRRYPGRFYGYRAVDPTRPDQLARELARYHNDPGFVGLKLHPSWHAYPINGPNYTPAWEFAQEHRLIVLTHSWGGSAYDRPEQVAEMAARYPGVTVLMGHAGFGAWDTAMALAREHDNLYLELTAAYRVSGIIERFVNEVGSHKVLFGTDLPWFDPHYAIGCVCFSRITDEDRHNILHRNAERLLAPFLADG